MNLLLYIALRGGSFLLAVVPASVMYRVAALVGWVAFFVFPSTRRALAANLAVVLDSSPRSGNVRRAARRAFQCDAKNWVDTMRISRLDPADIDRLVVVEGLEHLDRARAEGRGAVLVSLHLGNFDLVGQVLALREFRITVPVEHMQPEKLFRFITKARTSLGIQAVPVDRAPKEMLRALRAGNVVAVVADRHITGRATEVSFFGRPTLLPVAAATLVRHTGAPLFVGVGVRTAGDKFRGHIIPVLDGGQPRQRSVTDQEVMQKVATAMEQLVRRYPDQWLVFSPLWNDGTAPEQVATIKHSERDSGAMTGAGR